MSERSDVDIERWIVIPGFMKAGSTSVFSWLEKAFPAPVARPKEPRFFLDDPNSAANLGLYWRESSGGSRIAIDGSVAYLDPEASSSVATRISAAAVDGPNPRFIVLVRDPVARAISHIRHDMRRGRLDRIDEAGAAALIRPGQPYFERSRLATSIGPFVEMFPNERILILGADLADERKLGAISAFLGLREPLAAASVRRKNETSVERSYAPALAWIADHGLVSRAERLVPRRLRPLAARGLLRPPVEAIDQETVRRHMSNESLGQLADEMARFHVLTAACQRAY
jgi:hypothetical protein